MNKQVQSFRKAQIEQAQDILDMVKELAWASAQFKKLEMSKKEAVGVLMAGLLNANPKLNTPEGRECLHTYLMGIDIASKVVPFLEDHLRQLRKAKPGDPISARATPTFERARKRRKKS